MNPIIPLLFTVTRFTGRFQRRDRQVELDPWAVWLAAEGDLRHQENVILNVANDFNLPFREIT